MPKKLKGVLKKGKVFTAITKYSRSELPSKKRTSTKKRGGKGGKKVKKGE